jgi:transposase-like protein
MSKRRTHSPEFKAKVAMEAISGRKTIQEIAADHAIHPIQVSQWKRQRRPSKWCNSGGSAPAKPGLTARLPHRSAVAMGGPVCDPVRSTTTKPNTDHDPHP